MNLKAALKYALLTAGISLTAIASLASPLSVKTAAECYVSEGQTVVKWKDMYWFPCKYSWNGYCIWPLRRKHTTYKVTVNRGNPVLNEKGTPTVVASGKIRNWTVYDSTAWNGIETDPREKKRYPDYESIAENEYVVLVETRYRLFHNVEANLRICTQKPEQ